MLSTDRRKGLENRPRSIVGVEMERVNHQKESVRAFDTLR